MSVGGIINSLFGGVTGSGGGGGGGSDAWVTQPMSPASYAAGQIAVQQQQVTWQAILAGLVGTYSLIRNYQLQKRMVDLHERSVDQAEEYLELAKRHYDEISLPAFNRTRNHFDYVRDNWRPYLMRFIREAFRLIEYTPDYATQRGRAMSAVQAEFDKGRRMRARMRGRFGVGRACYEDALFAVRAAEARVSAADRGYRYEDAKKVDMDKWYWQRWTHGAETVAAAIANAISGINNSSAVATTGLNAVGTAVGRVGEAVRGLSGAMGDSRDFWGTVGTGAFRLMNYENQRSSMSSRLNANSMTTPNTIMTLGNGATQGFAGAAPYITGTPGQTSHVNTWNLGSAPY